MKTAPSLQVIGIFTLLAITVPFWGSGYTINLLTQIFLFGFLALAWNFMALTGLISLGHAAFFGVGGYAAAWLFIAHGVPLVQGALTGAVIAMLLASIVYWMVFRTGLRGIYFSGLTLVLAEALRFAAVNAPFLGRSQGLELSGLRLPPFLLYGLTLLALTLTAVGTWYLLRSSLGYRLRAVRENEHAAEALGVQTFRVKLTVTLLSAALTAIGGAMNVVLLYFVEPESDFGLMLSLNLLLGTFVGGMGTVLGPPVGIALLFGLREAIAHLGAALSLGSSGIYSLQQVLYGAILMVVVVTMPEGIVPKVSQWLHARRRSDATAPKVADTQAMPVPAHRVEIGGAGVRAAVASTEIDDYLQVNNVTLSFRGLVALSDVSFSLKRGEILGLIGPNGAGKTTMFNVISGIFRPDHGSIRFGQEPLSGLHPHEVCRRGVARTFQVVQPFGGMTVMENALIGALSRHTNKTQAQEAALAALAQVNLYAKRDQAAASLTLQDRKMLEFARALATEPKLILLDEVMAGLTPQEQSQIADKILEIRDEGISFLLVEHAMRAVMRLSDRIVVLDHGKVIATGLPAEIAENTKVVNCYLGRSLAHVPVAVPA
ncbi:branched-chain amino acid ABC transporter ATP-binding protein/permease [Candidimonas nitroreducens]|uniref:ABC transporter domain-containing protein n=1 Tax=Candidimonas nitroreducens TaxID=683354 RepID=A0A225MYU6_9BURK|nr:branched-chain amino acid ABC transporter ATP-binding protein/permease [Candidimonas nitroreducens]OWT66395.1 hypothetical protein CEY11_01290 [Candidimonas nitroreducens]